MIKSRNLFIALTILFFATLAMLATDTHPRESKLLQGYLNGARHWSTTNYYHNNQGGYQTSAAAWTRQVFYN